MEALHLISGADGGGAKTHVLSLLSELNKSGEVLLATLGGGVLTEEAKRRGIPCRELHGSFAETLRQTKSLCRELSPALLHCHGSRANLIGALLRGKVPCKVISTVHSDPRLDYQGRIAAGIVYGACNAFALRRMDALLCVSAAMTDTLRARGFPGERLYTVYNGIDPRRPAVETSRQDWRERQGIPREAVLVGAAGRMDPVKDYPTLLRGFAAAAREDERLYLALAGTGREEEKLRRLARTLGIEARTRFLGWVEDMESFLSALDIFAMSSRSETFPYVLLSAGRAGLAAISSAAGGVPELIEQGKTGLLFPVGDDEALSRALLELSASPEKRMTLGQALQTRTKEFTAERSAAQVRRSYAAITK